MLLLFLLMVDLDLLSDPFLFLFLLHLDGAEALIFFSILFKAHLGYLHDVRAFCRCSWSSFRFTVVDESLSTTTTSVLFWREST